MTLTAPISITMLWATETGRAKACARRTIRLLQSSSNLGAASIGIRGRCSFDDIDFLSLGRREPQQQQEQLLILFVSTTGDGEQTSSIRTTWTQLLSKSLPDRLFSSVKFALFALGDRAYGPDAFCAAGRKLATRLAQLGAVPVCGLGYGDDGSLNGGVFADLDVWLEEELFPAMKSMTCAGPPTSIAETAQNRCVMEEKLPYECVLSGDHLDNQDGRPEWQVLCQHYSKHFSHSCPMTAYHYSDQLERIAQPSNPFNNKPLLGRVAVNERITAEDWMQNTRHIKIHLTGSLDSIYQQSTLSGNIHREHLLYQAGDVASILPSNPPSLVRRFLSLLPSSIRKMADEIICIHHNPTHNRTTMSNPWPEKCTLRGLLTHCADLQSLPEREDLFALAAYCNSHHSEGTDQRNKLISLSETSGAALYGDYIIREKRNWCDVFYDFDSVRWEEEKGQGGNGHEGTEDADKGSTGLTISRLLTLLPSIAPRHFSIASSPSFSKIESGDAKEVGFAIELCVAVVEGTTPLGRSYVGCCSEYLASIAAPKDIMSSASNIVGPDTVRLWIHPGSFSKLPMKPSMEGQRGESTTRHFETPVMCIGAGTGIAPLRSLILEREARRLLSNLGNPTLSPAGKCGIATDQDRDNILVFGCRKKSKDYYYGSEWERLCVSKRLHLIQAFSREQHHKLYVQRALREADGGELIARHVLEQGGAVYIAGGSKMARAVKDEIVEALGARLDGGERDAKRLLNKLKRAGLFSIEAWS